jgi:von Willebrand factor type A domain
MRRFLVLICVALALFCASLPSGDALVPQHSSGTPQAHLDLILVIDTSGSMSGEGGTPDIFPQVQAAAKELISSCETGDIVELITFDSTTSMQPPVIIYGQEDKDILGKRIDSLRANGSWTYIADALAHAFSEAKRLDAAQAKNGEEQHTKAILLLTDGINDPPPAARSSQVSLSDIASHYAHMPWFVWQIQLGPHIDEQVSHTFSQAFPNYKTIHEAGAKDLLAQIRNSVIQRIEESRRNAVLPVLRLEPATIAFGTIRPGDEKRVEVRLNVSQPVSAKVQFLAEGQPQGLHLSFDPKEVATAGAGEKTVSILASVDRRAGEGNLSGRIVVQVLGGSLRTEPSYLRWTANVYVPTSPWKIAVGFAGAILGIGLLLFLFFWVRRPLLFGTLRYWTQGAAAQTVDLGSYRKRRLRIGGKPGCDVVLAGAPNTSATVMVAKVDGIPLCVVEADGDTSIQFQGRTTSHIELYNRDQFQLENYTIEYRGEVSERPKTR